MQKVKPIVISIMLTLSMGALIATAGHTPDSKTGTGFGVVQVSDPVSGQWILRAGATFCQNASIAGPAHCASAGRGGAIFDISHMNVGKTQHVIEGTFTASVVSCNPCGYIKVDLCNDRDDSGICTNVDPIDDDTGSSHGTNASFDDQSASCELNKAAVGGSCTIKFCFADDADDHTWDDLAAFIITDINNPSSGTFTLTLDGASHVGDDVGSCSAEAQANTGDKTKSDPTP